MGMNVPPIARPHVWKRDRLLRVPTMRAACQYRCMILCYAWSCHVLFATALPAGCRVGATRCEKEGHVQSGRYSAIIFNSISVTRPATISTMTEIWTSAAPAPCYLGGTDVMPVDD
jgi:hypothetical protein